MIDNITEQGGKPRGKPARTIALVVTVALVLILLIPALVPAETDDLEARIKALEARMDALEAQLEALPEQEGEAVAKGEDAEVGDQALVLGEPLSLGDGRTVTITEYETGTSFRYSPAGGFSTLRLSAKSGYSLLCLYVTVDNQSPDSLNTARLLDTVLEYGDDYTNKAQDSFFYLTSRGVYAGGLKSISPGATVHGCLLFAVPEGIDESGEQVTVRMTYGNGVYECELRPAGARLELGEATSF